MKKDYRPSIVQVSASKNENIDKVIKKLSEHRKYLDETGEMIERRKRNAKWK